MKIKLFIPYKTLISYTLFILSIFVFSCAPIVQKHIKKYIDTTNALLKKHKDRVHDSMRTKSTENSS